MRVLRPRPSHPVRPKIAVVCCFYNEEFLVPFFLSHYAFADAIHALVSPCTDKTLDLLAADKKVTLHNFEMPDGMDDIVKVGQINALLEKLDRGYDWVIVVDSDEFIWPEKAVFTEPASYLMSVPPSDTVLVARMWQVFRHALDADLDPANAPIVLQRRHGVEDRESPACKGYCKPIVIRTKKGIKFQPGNHALAGGDARISTMTFDGAHWAFADPCFLVNRIIKGRRDRQSKGNLKRGHGAHYHTISEQAIIDRCEQHLNDPKLF